MFLSSRLSDCGNEERDLCTFRMGGLVRASGSERVREWRVGGRRTGRALVQGSKHEQAGTALSCRPRGCRLWMLRPGSSATTRRCEEGRATAGQGFRLPARESAAARCYLALSCCHTAETVNVSHIDNDDTASGRIASLRLLPVRLACSRRRGEGRAHPPCKPEIQAAASDQSQAGQR